MLLKKPKQVKPKEVKIVLSNDTEHAKEACSFPCNQRELVHVGKVGMQRTSSALQSQLY